MAYSTGTAANQVALLEAIRDFAVAQGWTVEVENDSETYNYYTAHNAEMSTGKSMSIYKTDSYEETVYFHFYACYKAYPFPHATYSFQTLQFLWAGEVYRRGQISGIAITGSRGYNSGAANWADHATPCPRTAGASDASGGVMGYMIGQSLPYYLFSQGDSIHVAVEVFPGEFQHMSFGTLVKSHTYTGGQYFMASNYPDWGMAKRDVLLAQTSPYSDATNASVEMPWNVANSGNYGCNGGFYAEIEGGNYWGVHRYLTPSSKGETIVGVHSSFSAVALRSFLSAFSFGAPSTITSLSPQFPLYVRRYRSDTTKHVYLGYPEGIRFLNMKGLNPKVEKTLGSDVWKIFPTSIYDSGETYFSIGVPALSYLK